MSIDWRQLPSRLALDMLKDQRTKTTATMPYFSKIPVTIVWKSVAERANRIGADFQLVHVRRIAVQLGECPSR